MKRFILNKIAKIFIALVLVALFLISLYLFIIPFLLKTKSFSKIVEKVIAKTLKAEVILDKQYIKTSFSDSNILAFKLFSIKKDDSNIINIENFYFDFSIKKILGGNLSINEFNVDECYIDASGLLKLLPEQKKDKKQKKNNANFRLTKLENIGVKDFELIYRDKNGAKIDFDLDRAFILKKDDHSYIAFDAVLKIFYKDDLTQFKMNSKDNIYIADEKMHINNLILSANNSSVSLNALLARENGQGVTLKSDNFNAQILMNLIRSNLILPNGEEIASLFKDITARAKFNINISKKGIVGEISTENSSFSLVPLADLNVKVSSAKIKIEPDKITLLDTYGYWGDSLNNKVVVTGDIKDYLKTFESNILVDTKINDEFARKYLSKVVGLPFSMLGEATTKILYKSNGPKMGVDAICLLKKENDVLVYEQSFSPITYDRAVTLRLSLLPEIYKIEHINYYIASSITRESKLKPLVQIWGEVSNRTLALLNLGFKIPNPLPSEFLNTIAGPKFFQEGKISGSLEYFNKGVKPYIDSDLTMDKVKIPSLNLSINKGKFKLNKKGAIKAVVRGKYRDSTYDFKGVVENDLRLPIVVKNAHLILDDIDLLSAIETLNSLVPTEETDKKKEENIVEVADASSETQQFVFEPNTIEIKKSKLHVIKGSFKEVLLDDVLVNFTLSKAGLFKIDSNKFNIAQGTSSLDATCDLVNHKYDLYLDAHNIDSNAMADALFGIKDEIQGFGSGKIKISTDESLMLNGNVNFEINDGTIKAVGLLEYGLKFLSVFINPIAMMSPYTLFELTNIPDGKFDYIKGDIDIKDNVLTKIVVQSAAKELASLIVGKFDLTTRDATLRIYTRFANSDGAFSFLRNISLNKLSKLFKKEDGHKANYYDMELKYIPKIEADEDDYQTFLTKIDGDVEKNNFISSIKKIEN